MCLMCVLVVIVLDNIIDWRICFEYRYNNFYGCNYVVCNNLGIYIVKLY